MPAIIQVQSGIYQSVMMSAQKEIIQERQGVSVYQMYSVKRIGALPTLSGELVGCTIGES